jgi:hypothetical protein
VALPISDPMRAAPRALLASLALALAAPGAGPASAAGRESECLHAFDGAAVPTVGKQRIRCVDGDTSCDDDPTPGVCQIDVGACLNRSDPGGRCSGRELEGYAIANVQPDTDPRHIFEFQALQDLVSSVGLPIDAGESDECLGPVAMVLPLEVRIKKSGARYAPSKQKLHATVTGPDGARDEDKLPLQCVPAKGSDPCTGVTSTLDHLERHVFAPTCSRDTCHSGPQTEHSLSLLPGEAHAFLVGVQPDNLPARLAGKLRVDPGNPDNSFLLDKLRGTLAPDEGEGMPRSLPRIPKREIALVEAWIAAGAPAAGFVPGAGCQAP